MESIKDEIKKQTESRIDQAKKHSRRKQKTFSTIAKQQLNDQVESLKNQAAEKINQKSEELLKQSADVLKSKI